MARRRPPADDLIRAFLRLPPPAQLAVLAVALAAAVAYRAWHRLPMGPPPGPSPAATGPAAVGPDVAFAFWNVENLFDDRDDRRRSVDDEYDDAFAADPGLLRLKLDRLTSAVLRLNGGRGPDVLAVVEVEGRRAAELLRDALNAAMPDPALRYPFVTARDLDAGRHICPAVISRVPIDDDRTRLRGRQLRVLETRLSAGGHPLSLIVSHWTSQLRQRDGSDGDRGRENYAATVAEAVAELTAADPSADVLVCGDFNDTPDSGPVARVLRSTGDRSRVVPSADRPVLLNLLAGKPADRFGTLWYRGDPLVYDQICVSAGMLDNRGWGCDPGSVRVPTAGLIRPGATRRDPWEFGNPKRTSRPADRGFSDHFPVEVRLTVGGG